MSALADVGVWAMVSLGLVLGQSALQPCWFHRLSVGFVQLGVVAVWVVAVGSF